MNAPLKRQEITTTHSLINISEVFGPTIQGEGALIGVQTLFVRTGGCDYRCSWCDTGYAVLPKYENNWQAQNASQIMAEIEKLSKHKPMWVTLSGGNPAMQDLEPLIRLGQAKGYQFSMETQGSISKPWFALLDQLTFSPKPPSSGMKFKKRGLDRCLDECQLENNVNNANLAVSLKFVIADKEDLLWAKEIAEQYPHLPCFVQPCNSDADINQDKSDNQDSNKSSNNSYNQQQQMLWLIDAVQSLNWHSARVLPQLHTWLWGDKSGV